MNCSGNNRKVTDFSNKCVTHKCSENQSFILKGYRLHEKHYILKTSMEYENDLKKLEYILNICKNV
jgi:hypothetical protein